ncbi:MAG TPA: hypothetical protein VGD98_08325 [Ktedonobacteraceae bacterium]
MMKKKRTSGWALFTSISLALFVAMLSIGGTGAFKSFLNFQSKSQAPVVSISRVVPDVLPPHSRSDLERGMATSVWTKDGYNRNNPAYDQVLGDIYPQTKATWISMQVSFSQPTDSSTAIQGGSPTLQSFTAGIQAAREVGYSIFFEPLITVSGGSDRWAGHIAPQTVQEEALWFQNWFHSLQPYILAAQKGGVQQLAVGTELEWMQYHAPATIWTQFISQVRSLFTGNLLYDTNWDFAQSGLPYPSWFRSLDLKAIGVSTYLPLIKTRATIAADQAASLWDIQVRKPLDALSEAIKKPVVLSEFGYRDTSDAGYHPFEYISTLPHDGQEQSILFDAALPDIISDHHIMGVFLWSWSNAARFSLLGQPALAVIARWYSM